MLSIGEDNLVALPQAGSRAPNCTMAAKDPDEIERMAEEQTVGELAEPHGVINPNKATIHILSLDEALIIMETRIMAGEEKDVMKDTVTKFKDAISRVMPQMAEADVTKVMHAISDPRCLAL